MAKYKAKVNTKEVEEKKKQKKINKQVNKAVKDTKMLSDEQIQIRNFVLLLILMVAVVVGLYFLSNSIINKRENENTNTNTEVEISYDTINVGTILNRPYDEYYVFVFDASKADSAKYEAVLSTYKSSEDSLKIYSVDLSKKLNASHAAKNGESNPDVYDNVNDFKFGECTLLYISNGVVEGYYESYDEIRDILSAD